MGSPHDLVNGGNAKKQSLQRKTSLLSRRTLSTSDLSIEQRTKNLLSVLVLSTRKLLIRGNRSRFVRMFDNVFFTFSSSDAVLSDSSTVDQELVRDSGDVDIAISEGNVNSCLSAADRKREWLLSLKDVKESRYVST